MQLERKDYNGGYVVLCIIVYSRSINQFEVDQLIASSQTIPVLISLMAETTYAI